MENRTEKITELKTKLEKVIREYYTEWNSGSLKIAGYGVENAVFSVESNERGLLAIRVPWDRQVSNENDGELQSRYQLKKEAELASHCHKHGIPVPEVVQLHLGDDLDFLASQFIRGDHSSLSSYDIGALASKLHRVPSDGLQNIDKRKISAILSERIVKRTNALRRITSSHIHLPEEQEIERILQNDDHHASLLHMDIRPANLIGLNGHIQAIVDWNNAQIGSPVLDIMRTLETGELKEVDFLSGYNNPQLIDQTPEIIRALYRLDTAVMLAVLFHYYVKDAEKAEHYFNRVITITENIICK